MLLSQLAPRNKQPFTLMQSWILLQFTLYHFVPSANVLNVVNAGTESHSKVHRVIILVLFICLRHGINVISLKFDGTFIWTYFILFRFRQRKRGNLYTQYLISKWAESADAIIYFNCKRKQMKLQVILNVYNKDFMVPSFSCVKLIWSYCLWSWKQTPNRIKINLV